MDSSPPPVKQATALGVLCGAGAALCWALGFVAARHGVLIGLSPLVIALHRFVWPGLALHSGAGGAMVCTISAAWVGVAASPSPYSADCRSRC